MSLDDALFLVTRKQQTYHVKGVDVATKMKGGDRVLVQRNGARYYAYHGQVASGDTPYMTRRFTYLLEEDSEGNRDHPDGDGKINLSLYFGAAGPYPTHEWSNMRNKVKELKDLDGNEFTLQNNPDVEDGDIVHITEEGGPFQGWYQIQLDGNNFVKFGYQYFREDGRPRTDIKLEGPRPPFDGSAVLRFDFYRPDEDHPFDIIQDDDLLLAWDGTSNRRVTGANFKALFVSTSATISISASSVNTGDTYTISWNCTGGVQYRLRSPGGSYDVSASGSRNFYSSSAGNNTFTIEVLGADDSVLTSDSVSVEVIAPPAASISSSASTVNSGQTYRISWNCSGGDNYKLLLSNGLSWDNVKASDTWNFSAGSTSDTLTFTIQVLSANGSVLISDSVTLTQVGATATISSNKSTAGEGEIFRISWTASGGTSYMLHDSSDGSRYTVSSNSSKEFVGKSSAGTRTFTIEVYNSSGTELKTAGFNVRELGSGYTWIYGASVAPGGSGKWSHGDGKTKFHNTDDNGNYVESWWRSFSSGTRRIRLNGTYQDFYFPAPSSIGSGTGKNAQFSLLSLTGSVGTEIIIFDK